MRNNNTIYTNRLINLKEVERLKFACWEKDFQGKLF